MHLFYPNSAKPGARFIAPQRKSGMKHSRLYRMLEKSGASPLTMAYVNCVAAFVFVCGVALVIPCLLERNDFHGFPCISGRHLEPLYAACGDIIGAGCLALVVFLIIVALQWWVSFLDRLAQLPSYFAAIQFSLSTLIWLTLTAGLALMIWMKAECNLDTRFMLVVFASIIFSVSYWCAVDALQPKSRRRS